jgi:hypothetical protein
MPQPTSISVVVDNTEYSRYEPDHAEITVTVDLTGGTPYSSEEITVELIKARRSRDAVVATTTITFDGAVTTGEATFDLREIVDQDIFSLVRHGKYFVRATSAGVTDVTGDSDDFDIRIMTIDRLKKNYLFGIPLVANEIRMIKFAPVNITGIEVLEVSRTHRFGAYTLSYSYVSATVRTLQWNGGPIVNITAPGTYVLRSGGSGLSGACGNKILSSVVSQDYIVVRVRSLASLPSTSVTDELLIDRMELDDEAIGRYIDTACSWLENVALGIYLEPTNVVTDRDPSQIQFSSAVSGSNPILTDTDYDFVVNPLTHFIRNGGAMWQEIQTPFVQLLRVDSLFGAIANTRVIDIDIDWIHWSNPGGMIQLVPMNQTTAFDYIGLISTNALRGSSEIPSFWHFNMIVGLRDCPWDLQEVIGKKAAMDVLAVVGAALRPGVGSVSLGRDGVSQSVSYTTQAQFGPYSGLITAYKTWIDEQLKQYKGKYRGPTLVVV